MKRIVVLATLLLAVLACGGLGEDTPVEPEATAPVDMPTEVSAEPVEARAEPPPQQTPPAAPTILRQDADPIAAFTEDCGAVFTEVDGFESSHTDECIYLEFNQMYAEDLFDCRNTGESCRSACGQPCQDCQSTCTEGCTDCKSDCEGDDACIRQCAESRQDCRASCLDALNQCKGPTCNEVESDCHKQSELTIRRTCPRCDEIRACVMQSYTDGTFAADPCRKAIHAKEECYTWCHPGR